MTTLQIPTARVFEPLLRPSRYKGIRGGRGSGKSHFFADRLVETALFRQGLRAVCVREVQKSLEQSVKRLIEDKIQKFDVGDHFTVMDKEIRCPGDGLIIFQGMQNHTAESIKSLEGYHIAWIEEAQSLSQRSLDLLRPTIREEGSEIWASWNPHLPTDPIEQLLCGDETHPDAVVVLANWNHNPWLPDVLRAEKDYDKKRDPDKYAHIWNGGFVQNSEARVFRNWREDSFDTPDGVIFYHGADWGFSVDPTVLVRCFIVGRTLYVDREVYAVGCEIDRTPTLFDKIPTAREWPVVADSARPETIDYMRRHGYPRITAARKGPDSVKDGIEFLKSFDIVVHPRCRHTIDELTLYSWKVDPTTGLVLPVLSDKKNHVIDALRYALEGARAGNVAASRRVRTRG